MTLLSIGQRRVRRRRTNRRELRDRRLIGLLIERERFGHVFRQAFDACFVSRVCGKKFLRLLASGSLLHALPHSNGFLGIVAGIRRKEKSDIVRFRFMSAAEWKQDAYLRANPQSGHGGLARHGTESLGLHGN